MKILVINGPNMNLLGLREPDIYGRQTYADLVDVLQKRADEINVMIRELCVSLHPQQDEK